jgi:hypothetical protein
MYAKIVLLVESRYNDARDENGGKLKCEFQLNMVSLELTVHGDEYPFKQTEMHKKILHLYLLHQFLSSSLTKATKMTIRI